MTGSNKKSVTAKKVLGNYDKMLAAFGGMVAGKTLSHFLDKAITSQPVQGLVGVELSENLSKYVKPIAVTGAGMVTFAVSKNQLLKYAGIGCAGIGVSELTNVMLGKDYLAGLSGANGFGNNDDFQIIDLETMQTIPPAPSLELPILSGDTDLKNSENYQEVYTDPDFSDNELEAA
ncbi:MAG: hypothetical protein L3J56_00505 [Bacteroidales bacterium]|nr:hypothetical protein [Bacteroidales bacterium]